MTGDRAITRMESLHCGCTLVAQWLAWPLLWGYSSPGTELLGSMNLQTLKPDVQWNEDNSPMQTVEKWQMTKVQS